MNPRSVIVIGAGIGGISAAIHLAHQGVHVTVVEKNASAGGRCGRFSWDGHHFDTGPTLLILPLVYEEEFSRLGLNFYEFLDPIKIDPTYHIVFDNGDKLALTSDMTKMREQLDAIEPGGFDGYLRYMDEGHQHYDLAMERLVVRDFRTAAEFYNLENLALVFRLKLLVKHYDNMGAYFDSPRLKATFTFQDSYMGLSPFEAPAVFSMMPYTEMAHGVFYPKGGMYRIVDTLVDAAEHAGVEFLFGNAVKQICVQGDRAQSIEMADGCIYEADTLVANADLPYVYDQLLPDKRPAQRLARKRFSCSVMSFFWGVDKVYPELKPHTLFLADDYKANFDSIVDELTLPDNPSLYIHAPARIDPSMAPPGQDTLVAIVPIGHMDDNADQNWKSIQDEAREAIFRRLRLLEISDLQSHIKFEMSYSPPSWRKRYNLMKGATHGLAHTLLQLGFLRPHNRHPRYHNLYFVGSSTHPGTGAPTALISARLAAERLLDDLGIHHRGARSKTGELAWPPN